MALLKSSLESYCMNRLVKLLNEAANLSLPQNKRAILKDIEGIIVY
jgi:hypothetical protein